MIFVTIVGSSVQELGGFYPADGEVHYFCPYQVTHVGPAGNGAPAGANSLFNYQENGIIAHVYAAETPKEIADRRRQEMRGGNCEQPFA